MKVTCQSCQAKYSIADEKVRGKVAKIRCKKCGTTIIVDGTAVDPAAGSAPQQVEGHAEPARAEGAEDDSWTVLVADGDQRTVSVPEMVDLMAKGTITLENHVWKDGMADWLPIAQVEALRAACAVAAAPRVAEEAEDPPTSIYNVDPSMQGALGDLGAATAAASNPEDRAAHTAQVSTAGADAREPAAAQIREGAFPAVSKTEAAKPSPAEVAASLGATAARTEPKRGRGAGTDLFGAPRLDEALAAPQDGAAAPAAVDRPTGARNENSVLFSLSALTGGTRASQGTEEPSGLADLRYLTSQASASSSEAKKSTGMDDIMNLGAGGLYTGALASPVLAPPPVETGAESIAYSGASVERSKGKRTLLYAILGMVAVAGAAAAIKLSGDKASESAKEATSASAAASSLAAAASAGAAASAAAPEANAEASAAPALTALAPGATIPKPESDKPKAAAPAAHEGAGASRSDEPKKAAAAQVFGPAEKAPAAAPVAAAAAPGASFDRAAAISTLSAIATAVQACKKADGPSGTGRVSITFAPSGNATTATVEGPPFAGTSVGGCVASRFRGAHVPPFSGDSVTVHKTFTIN